AFPASPRNATVPARRGAARFTSQASPSKSTSSTSSYAQAGSINSRQSMKRPGIGSSRSTITTLSSPPFTSSTRSARRSPQRSGGFKTDNGSEWGTDFTWHLHDLGIAHKHIPPGCPESNGKVERSHRTDEDEFYRRVAFTTRPERPQAARVGAR